MLRNLPEGISEVHIHPSILSDEIKEINPTWNERVLEYQIMMDDDVLNEVKKLNIELITYKDINNINKHKSKFKSILSVISLSSEYSIKLLKCTFKRIF